MIAETWQEIYGNWVADNEKTPVDIINKLAIESILQDPTLLRAIVEEMLKDPYTGYPELYAEWKKSYSDWEVGTVTFLDKDDNNAAEATKEIRTVHQETNENTGTRTPRLTRKGPNIFAHSYTTSRRRKRGTCRN